VLFAAAEMVPLAKTGGLGDVLGALPAALARLGLDVHVVLPGYESALDLALAPRKVVEIDDVPGVDSLRIYSAFAPDTGVPLWLVDAPRLFRRGGTPYLDEHCNEWPDNALRFGVLCHAITRLALGTPGSAWRPDLVHCHDWHTGLVPLLLRGHANAPASLFTIHNIAFQGNYPVAAAAEIGLPGAWLGPEGIEYHGRFSFLKAGILGADRVSTVSPTYAREICTPDFGCGMDGVLRTRSEGIAGILNGIDNEVWNPNADPFIARRYGIADRSGKRACKFDLLGRLGLAADLDAPLAAYVSRVTWQKMADVLLRMLPPVLERNLRLQFALLGQGEHALEQGYADLARRFPGRVSVAIGYSEDRAHRLHAGADMLLHGSRFEPCGLAHQYAMRYGTLPIVRRTGGLADSVIDADTQDAEATSANGFVFDRPDADEFAAAIERALACFEHDQERWRALARNAMQRDASWTASAQAYSALYCSLLPAPSISPLRSALDARRLAERERLESADAA
jgi:starch synthase